jgi:hypothetical protein
MNRVRVVISLYELSHHNAFVESNIIDVEVLGFVEEGKAAGPTLGNRQLERYNGTTGLKNELTSWL